MRTFLVNNGVYPVIEEIISYIDKLDLNHIKKPDLAAHNSILDHDKLILIDQNDEEYDNSKWFYHINKEAFKASIFLSYPITPPKSLSNKFIKLLCKTNKGNILTLIMIDNNNLKVYTTFSDKHSLHIRILETLYQNPTKTTPAS